MLCAQQHGTENIRLKKKNQTTKKNPTTEGIRDGQTFLHDGVPKWKDCSHKALTKPQPEPLAENNSDNYVMVMEGRGGGSFLSIQANI